MKFKVHYYDIDNGAHIFATPSYTRTEYIEADTTDMLHEYISKQRDLHGCKFKLNAVKSGVGDQYDYISGQGALRFEPYEPPVKPEFTKV